MKIICLRNKRGFYFLFLKISLFYGSSRKIVSLSVAAVNELFFFLFSSPLLKTVANLGEKIQLSAFSCSFSSFYTRFLHKKAYKYPRHKW